jgi:hypothetical protein
MKYIAIIAVALSPVWLQAMELISGHSDISSMGAFPCPGCAKVSGPCYVTPPTPADCGATPNFLEGPYIVPGTHCKNESKWVGMDQWTGDDYVCSTWQLNIDPNATCQLELIEGCKVYVERACLTRELYQMVDGVWTLNRTDCVENPNIPENEQDFGQREFPTVESEFCIDFDN